MPKIRPRTKYINCKYWNQGIKTHSIHQGSIADLLLKILAENKFIKLKDEIMGKQTVDKSDESQGSVRKYVG